MRRTADGNSINIQSTWIVGFTSAAKLEPMTYFSVRSWLWSHDQETLLSRSSVAPCLAPGSWNVTECLSTSFSAACVKQNQWAHSLFVLLRSSHQDKFGEFSYSILKFWNFAKQPWLAAVPYVRLKEYFWITDKYWVSVEISIVHYHTFFLV